MRTTTFISLTALVGLATGCAAVDSDLQYRGTLDAKTDGLVLFEDGQAGHAAMSNTTCLIHPDGSIADDVDVTGDNENVLDGSSSDGTVVLARTQQTLHIVEPMDMEFGGVNWGETDPRVTHSFDVVGLTDALLTDDGIVTLAGCSVGWLDSIGGPTELGNISLDGCTGMEPAFAADRATGNAFVALDTVQMVTPTGVTDLRVSGDLLAWSPDMNGLLVATQGSNTVQFVETDGTVRWSTELIAPIYDIADLGARGSVVVMLEQGREGELVELDAQTGLVTRSFDLPGAADLVTSANGQTIAMVLERAVHYYSLR